MAEGVTRRGRAMRLAIKEKIIEVLRNPVSRLLPQRQQAKLAGVSTRTWRDYLTDEVTAEVRLQVSRGLTQSDVWEVDQAMLAKAREGSVGAAQLIYARVAAMGKDDFLDLITLEEMEEELKKLKGESA